MATIPSGKNKTRGVMLNDHVGNIFGRWMRPKIFPLLVARSQAIDSARRGAVMTQFTTRVFFDVATLRGLLATAVFCDLAAAHYSVVRQYVVGTDLAEQRLLVLMDILGVDPVQRLELVAFLRKEGSLLRSAGPSPALQQLMRDMNEDTWFKLDGSPKVTGMVGGCRPGEPIADLVFVFMFGKVLKGLRSVLLETEYGWTLGMMKNQYVEGRCRGHTAQETEEAYADDCVYILGHEDSEKLLAGVRFTTEEVCKAAERHGLKVNFGVTKTEALLVLRGSGKKQGKTWNSEGIILQSRLLVKNSELWNNASTWAQCVSQVVQWARRCRGEWIARG